MQHVRMASPCTMLLLIMPNHLLVPVDPTLLAAGHIYVLDRLVNRHFRKDGIAWTMRPASSRSKAPAIVRE